MKYISCCHTVSCDIYLCREGPLKEREPRPVAQYTLLTQRSSQFPSIDMMEYDYTVEPCPMHTASSATIGSNTAGYTALTFYSLKTAISCSEVLQTTQNKYKGKSTV